MHQCNRHHRETLGVCRFIRLWVVGLCGVGFSFLGTPPEAVLGHRLFVTQRLLGETSLSDAVLTRSRPHVRQYSAPHAQGGHTRPCTRTTCDAGRFGGAPRTRVHIVRHTLSNTHCAMPAKDERRKTITGANSPPPRHWAPHNLPTLAALVVEPLRAGQAYVRHGILWAGAERASDPSIVLFGSVKVLFSSKHHTTAVAREKLSTKQGKNARDATTNNPRTPPPCDCPPAQTSKTFPCTPPAPARRRRAEVPRRCVLRR